jgi:hypothetical protein
MGTLSPVLFKAISYGIKAPNPHNTQAWKIKTLDAGSFLLYVDETRLLPASDPPARQIHLGQGTFIEMLSVGMTGEGYETLVDYFPEGEYGAEECGKKPVARITVQRNDEIRKDNLCDAISRRQTNRNAYTGPPVSVTEWDTIMFFVGRTHSAIFPVVSDEDVRRYIRITEEAVKTDIYYPAAYEETWQWLRKNEEETKEYRDGLSLRGQGFFSGLFGGVIMKFAESSISTHEKYLSEKTRAKTVDMFRKTIATARGFLFQKTRTNTPLDWVKSGRDYARLNLAATRTGLAMHPLNQVLQEYPAMDMLRREFETVAGQNEGEKVQMLVRVGRALPGYHSPRRAIESFLMEDA